jgi:hypothetical protein
VCIILFLELVDLEDMMGAMGCYQAPQGPARQMGLILFRNRKKVKESWSLGVFAN